MIVWISSLIQSSNLSAMAVESVTVVAPEVRVGPFSLSKGILTDINTPHTSIKQIVYHTTYILLITYQLIACRSSGLVEQINNFQTLSLRDLSGFNFDPFLSIDDDYFYHTQNPRRPEVRYRNVWFLKGY